MIASAHKALTEQTPFVLAKAVDNINLCQFFMGILGRTVWEANKRGYDVFSVKIDMPHLVSTINGMTLRAKVHFNLGPTFDMGFMNGRSEGIMDFVGKKSEHLYTVMKKNPTYAQFLQRSVEKLETWALQQGVAFSTLQIRHGFLSRDDYIILELV